MGLFSKLRLAAVFLAVVLAGWCGKLPAQDRTGLQPFRDGLQTRPTPSEPTRLATPPGQSARPTGHAGHMLDDAALTDVFFVDAETGWAVGDRGAIWHTGDAGRSWHLQQSDTTARLESVHFIDRQTGWAVGGTVQPYSQRSSGVVLRTLNGGRRWTKLRVAELPQLKSVKFSTSARGWAVGAPSAMYGGGVFRTGDGGRTWSPINAASEHWLCADFRDENSGAIAGAGGKSSVVMKQGAVRSRMPGLGLRSIRDLKLQGETSGWLVGDGGLVMKTADAGLTWQLPPQAIPPAARHEIEFKAVAMWGDNIWAVGSPGALVLHSPDGGRNWRLQPTGQSLPLYAIQFTDDRRGWAVGAMGTILATNDGGKTWQRQRSGGTRAAVLIIVADERDIPLELIARLGADAGYLCVTHVVGREDPTKSSPLAASQQDRTTAAVTASGGTNSMHSWRYPLPHQQLAFSEEQIIKRWNRAHDGRALPLVQAELVRTIRTWRPDVVITVGESKSQRQSGQNGLVGRLVQAAAKGAGDTTIHPEQLTHGGLAHWQVKKVFTICEADVAGDVSISGSSLALRLQQSLSEYCADAHAMLQPSPAERTLYEFRLANHRVAQEVARRDFFSGIVLHPGGEARRRLGEVPPGNVDALRRAAQKRRNVAQLIAQTESVAIGDDAWLGQVNELTRGLSDSAAARLIYQLASRYAETGRADLAVEAFQILAERYRTEPISEQAFTWLIRHYTSSEAAWRRRDRAHPDVQRAKLELPLRRNERSPSSGATPVVFDQPEDSTHDGEIRNSGGSVQSPRRAANQLGRAISLYRILQQTSPSAAADPQLQLAIAAAYRTSGELKQAEAIYRQIAGAGAATLWQACAKAELWLGDPRSDAPKPLAHCVRTAEKPFLDGKLDDELWKAARPLKFASSGRGNSAAGTEVRLAVDAEYLYLAARCECLDAYNYESESGKRVRDADLSASDRIELFLDVNRDWNSAYRIAIDHRGQVSEACAGDGSWNPAMHIASAQDESAWTIEAAIPLIELGSQSPKARDVWAMGVQRVTPGVGMQTWPVKDGFEPHAMGLLLFE